MRWLLNWHGVIDMETKTLMEPVEKYYFAVVVEKLQDVTELNREIRNWLGMNCECTWETKLAVKPTDLHADVIGIYFDLDTPEDEMMAFKLRWI